MNRELIDEVLKLELDIEKKTEILKAKKAQLLQEGFIELQNKGKSSASTVTKKAICQVFYKKKLKIVSLDALKKIFGKDITDKVDVEVVTKYTPKKDFKLALIALKTGEFGNTDLECVFRDMGLTEDQIKLATKKIKGDYDKDIKFLASIGIDVSDGREEEMDLVKMEMNKRRLNKYISDDGIEELKGGLLDRAVSMEESLDISVQPINKE